MDLYLQIVYLKIVCKCEENMYRLRMALTELIFIFSFFGKKLNYLCQLY